MQNNAVISISRIRCRRKQVKPHWTSSVRQVVPPSKVGALLAASVRSMEELLARDAARVGNRGPRRYSLGSASKTHHMAP